MCWWMFFSHEAQDSPTAPASDLCSSASSNARVIALVDGLLSFKDCCESLELHCQFINILSSTDLCKDSAAC